MSTQLAINSRDGGTLQHDPGGRDDVTIPKGLAITGLRVRISGTLDNAEDAADDASRNDFGEAKLIKMLRLIRDGENIVELRGDEAFIAQLPTLSSDGPELTQVDPDEASSDFSASILLPLTPWHIFARPEAFRQAHWSKLIRPESEFRLEAEFEDAAANANSDPGTGALADGGDHAYSLSDVDIKVDILYNDIRREALFDSEGVVRIPRFVPLIESQRSDETWSAARPDLPVTVNGPAPVLYSILAEFEGNGPTSTLEDMVNRVELTVEDEEIRDIDKAALVERAVDELPAISRTSPPGADAGNLLVINYADGGKVGSILRPAEAVSVPEFTLDVDAPPGGGDGHIDHIMYRLVTVPGATAGFARSGGS
ncbi:MAG: hypothetical protein ACOC5E_02440 [Acidobacteriota bacterium]